MQKSLPDCHAMHGCISGFGRSISFRRHPCLSPSRMHPHILSPGPCPKTPSIPLLIGDAYREGDYQLLLHVDEFYRMRGSQLPSPSFLSKVPIRFRIVSAAARLHLPVR